MRHILLTASLLLAVASAFGQINIQTNFDPATGQPIDTRFWMDALSDTSGVADTWKYEGLTVWAKDIDEHWFYNGNYWQQLAVQGPQGVQGATGPAGADGSDGAQGIQGVAGNDGADGAQGIQGVQGPPGSDGADGTQGIQGVQGVPGADGVDGDDITPGANGTFLTSYGAVTSWENIGVELYASPRTYAVNKLVVRDGLIYRAKTAGATNPTVANTTDWELATKVAWDDIEGKPTDLATDADVAAAQAAAQAYADANDEGSNWMTAGSNVYRSSGFVGVGTNDPIVDLHLFSNGNTEMRVEAGDYATFRISSDLDLTGDRDPSLRFNTQGVERWRMGVDQSTANGFAISSGSLSSSAAIFIREDNDRVGLGVNPQRTLDVNGNMRLRTVASGSPVGVLGYETDGDIVDGTSIVNAAQAAAQAYADANDEGSNWIISGSNAYRSSGNVGVGIVPSYKLDVNGNSRIIGDITIQPSSGNFVNGRNAIKYFYSGSNVLIQQGALRSSGDYFMGFAVGADPNVASGYVSSAGNAAFTKSSLRTGANEFSWAWAPGVTVPIGDPVTLSTKFKVTKDGRVAINKETPSYNLDVSGNGVFSDRVSMGGNAFASSTLTLNDVGYSTTLNSKGKSRLFGDVGIGTDPDAAFKLKVQGNTRMGIDRNSTVYSPGRFVGAFGAANVTGVLDWNDISNAYPGSGATLLRGVDASNAPNSLNAYYHPFTYEFLNKSGGGNLTQFAIPYSPTASMRTGMYARGRESGSWGEWYQFPSVPVSSLTNGDVLQYESAARRWVSAAKTTSLYTGSGIIPSQTIAQSYSVPGGVLGGTNLYFTRSGSSSTWHTGFESEGNNGTGFKLDHRVNGSGTTISASLRLQTGAHIATMSGDTWYYNNGGQYFGIKWSGLFPQWRVGATQFLDFPNALPVYDNMQWTQNRDGSGKFVIAPYRVSKDRSDQLTNESFATDSDLTLTLPGGSYHVRAVLVFEGENTNSELTYRLSASGSWTEDGYVSLHTNATETKPFGDTFGENVRTINSTRQYQVILEGSIFIQGASGTIAVQRGVLSSSNYVDLLEGSLLTATYKPNNL